MTKNVKYKKYDKSSKLRQLSAFLLVQYFFQLSLFVRFGLFSAIILVLFVHQCLGLSVSPLLLSNAFNLEWCTPSHWHQCITDYRPSYKHCIFCFVFVDPFQFPSRILFVVLPPLCVFNFFACPFVEFQFCLITIISFGLAFSNSLFLCFFFHLASNVGSNAYGYELSV